jgi:hypothetical protein
MKNIKTFEDFVGGSDKTNEEAEGAMYKTALSNIIRDAEEIKGLLSDDEDLEAWVQDKITIAEHNMDAILGYMQGEKGKKKMELPVQGDMKTGGMLKDEN